MMRAALHNDAGLVVNVLELPDGYDADQPGSFQPPEGHSITLLDEGSPVAPGWTIDGDTVEPPADAEPDPADPRPTCESLAAEVLELREEIAELRGIVAALPPSTDPTTPSDPDQA